MSELNLSELLALLDDDRSLLQLLLDEGLLRPPIERAYSPEEAEAARVARVLYRELDVNLAGVEVILHMRREVVSLRRQMAAVIEQLIAVRRPQR